MSARRVSGDRSDCVSPEQIADFVESRLPERYRLEVADHIMACPACREEFELLRALRIGYTDLRNPTGEP